MPQRIGEQVRHLWLLRHGKAASDAPRGGSDSERPLTARGRRDASALGARLAEKPRPLGLRGVHAPELALCSAAVRTRQTADLVSKGMGGRLPVESFRSLYDATTDVVLRVVCEIDDAVTSALVVGHNPTIVRLAWELLAEGDGDADNVGASAGRAALEGREYPTCSVAVIALPIGSWAEAMPATGTLVGLFRPPY